MEKATSAEVKAMVAELEAEAAAQAPQTEEPKVETPEVKPTEEPKDTKAEPPKVEARTRRSDAIPAAKFHEVRHELQAEKEKAKKLEKELEELRQVRSQPNDDLDEVAKKIAADKADPEVVKDIIRAARDISQPKVDTSALEARLAAIESEKAKAEDERLYRQEEDATLTKFPELKEFAKDLKNLAYTVGNESIPLEYLALKLKADLNLGDKAAPSESVSVPPSGQPKDYSNMTEEDFANLTSKELDVFIRRNLAKRR